MHGEKHFEGLVNSDERTNFKIQQHSNPANQALKRHSKNELKSRWRQKIKQFFLLSTFLRRKNAKQSKQRSRFSFPEPTNKVIFFYLNKIQHFWAKHLNDNSENFRQFFCLAALLKKKYFGRLWIRSQVFFCNLKNGWFSFSTVGNSICVLSRVCL